MFAYVDSIKDNFKTLKDRIPLAFLDFRDVSFQDLPLTASVYARSLTGLAEILFSQDGV